MQQKVFISHSSSELDSTLVNITSDALEAAGFKPIVAEREFNPLTHLGEKVRALIADADFFLGILTIEGQKSPWVQQELGAAYNGSKPSALFVERDARPDGFMKGLEYFEFEDERSFTWNLHIAIAHLEQIAMGEGRLQLDLESDFELRKILDAQRAENRQTVIEEILKQLGPKLDNLLLTLTPALMDPEAGFLRKTGLDNFAMRTETLCTMLADLREQGNSTTFEKAMYKSGSTAGRAFGWDFMMTFLLSRSKSVRTYEDLIKLWLYYDQTAGWGRFALGRALPEIRIDVRDSFLSRDELTEGRHQYCEFLSGYIDGFFQFTLRRVPRYVWEAGFRFDGKIIAPIGVRHEVGPDGICYFHVDCGQEKDTLTSGFDHLFRSELAFRRGDSIRAIQHARVAMEFGVKGLLDVPESAHDSFHTMVKQIYKDPEVANRISARFSKPKSFRDTYGLLSKTVHSMREPEPSILRRMALHADEFLNALERL